MVAQGPGLPWVLGGAASSAGILPAAGRRRYEGPYNERR